MFASEYGWTQDQILDTTIANLSKLSDCIRDRNRDNFIRATKVQEWAALKISTTVAGSVEDKGGKFQKSVAKARFPWKEFGFGDLEDYDDDDTEDEEEYLTKKPPKPEDEFDYIFGDGNTKEAIRDNRQIGNLDMALGQAAIRR